LGNLVGIDLVVFGVAAMDGLHLESVTQDESNPFLGAEIGEPLRVGGIPHGGKCDPLVERKLQLPGRPRGEYSPCNSVLHEGANPSLQVQE
jgi:hypothetical protein